MKVEKLMAIRFRNHFYRCVAFNISYLYNNNNLLIRDKKSEAESSFLLFLGFASGECECVISLK